VLTVIAGTTGVCTATISARRRDENGKKDRHHAVTHMALVNGLDMAIS
jgi:hypothetical protein